MYIQNIALRLQVSTCINGDIDLITKDINYFKLIKIQTKLKEITKNVPSFYVIFSRFS